MTDHNVSCMYRFNGISADVQTSIKKLVHKNLQGKMDAYVKPFLQRDDAEVGLNCKILKNKKSKYEGVFRLMCDGKTLVYRNKIPFHKLQDLVNHAFKHFKSTFSREK